MRSRITVVSFMLLLLVALADTASWGAQEPQDAAPFGPQDVFPLFGRALQAADLIILKDGSIVSATIEGSAFTLNSPTVGEKSFSRDEITAIVFADTAKKTSDQIFLRTGDQISGTLKMEQLHAQLVLSEKASLQTVDLKAVLLRFSPQGNQPRQPGFQGGFRAVLGLFTDLILSVTKYDTFVFADGQLASVLLDNRDQLAFTIESSFFGRFTFTPVQLAWVTFARSADQPDQLALKNGDRVSGPVTAERDLTGKLTSGGAGFSLKKEALRTELRQTLFQIPVRLFGGGGGHQKPGDH